MSTPLTLECLVAAIRNPATTMEDLTRMVGPDIFESEQQQARLRTIDSLWERADRQGWGNRPESWPTPCDQQYSRLSAASRDFENRYC